MIVSRDGLQWIEPSWDAPTHVRAVSTLRTGGVSVAPYDSLNLASHVGDDPAAVRENRQRLATVLRLPGEPCWLHQVHGTQVVGVRSYASYSESPIADASVAFEPGPVCVVMTADCLPLLFCTRSGDRVAAAHAGWRGLVAGVLEATVQALQAPGSQLLVWLGPAIGCNKFEVGDEVRDAFIARNAANQGCFVLNEKQRWCADIYALARIELLQLGVSDIFSDAACTATDAVHFFSYRREGQTGRMASMIWLQPH